MYRWMHVLVEGRDDREFFNVVIMPILQEQYDHVQIWEYAGATIDRRISYLRSAQAMKADYLFVSDMNTSPCVTARKGHLVECHKNMVDPGRAIVVRREIESWYMAGIGDEACRELGLASLPRMDDITKEQFEKLIPQRFVSVVDFMSEILKKFSIETAKRKNNSFRYFMEKVKEKAKKDLA
ncbi:MAG: hypothetical protein A2Z25_07780 [Planctomycetes bacterium RBG_16_55_9]|nr:MAG: hypothetical protein A2Z25_07780 [Planctomycetes bacterium RBG_16_55_9]